ETFACLRSLSLFASSCPTNPFSLLPNVILTAPHLSFQQLFFSRRWVLRFLASPRGTARPTLPQLNLHNIRFRRNPEPLPSSRCIESAQPTVLVRASCLLALPIQHYGLRSLSSSHLLCPFPRF